MQVLVLVGSKCIRWDVRLNKLDSFNLILLRFTKDLNILFSTFQLVLWPGFMDFVSGWAHRVSGWGVGGRGHKYFMALQN